MYIYIYDGERKVLNIEGCGDAGLPGASAIASGLLPVASGFLVFCCFSKRRGNARPRETQRRGSPRQRKTPNNAKGRGFKRLP